MATAAGADIFANGTLVASGATFGDAAGNASSFAVSSGGALNLYSGTKLVKWAVSYAAGSSGSIQGAQFDANSKLTILSDSLNIAGSTFTAAMPIEAIPNAVPDLADNTFASSNPATINVLPGAIDQVKTWGPIANVASYFLTTDLTVAPAVVLTINSGAKLTVAPNAKVNVKGTLHGAGTFVDISGNHSKFGVTAGGVLNLLPGTSLVGWDAVYSSSASRSMQQVTLDATSVLTLCSSNVSVAGCTSNGKTPVTAIPMTVRSWWMTRLPMPPLRPSPSRTEHLLAWWPVRYLAVCLKTVRVCRSPAELCQLEAVNAKTHSTPDRRMGITQEDLLKQAY